jgi:predicted RNA methylase
LEIKHLMYPYFYIYDRREGTLPVAEAEAEMLSEGKVTAHGVVEGRRRVLCAETGYLRAGAELLAKAATLSELVERIAASPLAGDSYRIVPEAIPRKIGGAFQAVQAVARCIAAPADLANPSVEFLLVVSAEGFWFGRILPAGDDSWLRFDQKPRQFCNASPLRLARAVLGMTLRPGDRVYDPCCGSGTIPFLAWSMGCQAFGSDCTWPTVIMARENLAHFDCPAPIANADARLTERTADCIVTNPPYDLFSPTSDDAIGEMLSNFRRLAPRVSLITSMDLNARLASLNYTLARQLTVHRHDFRRHLYFLQSP